MVLTLCWSVIVKSALLSKIIILNNSMLTSASGNRKIFLVISQITVGLIYEKYCPPIWSPSVGSIIDRKKSFIFVVIHDFLNNKFII